MDIHGESGKTAPGTVCQYSAVCMRMAKVTIDMPGIGERQVCYMHESFYDTLQRHSVTDEGWEFEGNPMPDVRYGISDHEGKQNFIE